MNAFLTSFEYSVGDVIQAIAVIVSILGIFITTRENRSKLSVFQRVNPIFSSAYYKQGLTIPLLEILYDKHALSDPYILEIDIVYSGNAALIQPTIKITSTERIELFGGSITNIPDGYEDLWSVNKIDSYTYDLELKHINPKQSLKVHFITATAPTKNVSISCTMPNLEVHDSGHINNKLKANNIFLTRSNIFLLCITGMLGITAKLWSHYVYALSKIMGGSIPAYYSVPFILSTFLLAVMLNAFDFPSMDAQWVINRQKRRMVMMVLVLLSIFSFYPLALVPSHHLFCIIQDVVGGCIVVALAVFIRLIIVDVECRNL